MVHTVMLLFGSSLGHFWVKKFRPSKPRGDKTGLFLYKNKEKVLKTEAFRTFRGGYKRDRTAVVCLPERLSKVLDEEKRPTFRLVLVEISGIEPLTS